MNELTVQFKLGPEGKQPTKANPHDAGWDIYASSDAIIINQYIEYKTDLFISIPEGWVGHIYPRSSISKYDLMLCNSVGTIDSGYLGEISFRFNRILQEERSFDMGGPKRWYPGDTLYKKGDKIGQFVFSKVPTLAWKEVTEFEDTVRGSGGFGSSGQ